MQIVSKFNLSPAEFASWEVKDNTPNTVRPYIRLSTALGRTVTVVLICQQYMTPVKWKGHFNT